MTFPSPTIPFLSSNGLMAVPSTQTSPFKSVKNRQKQTKKHGNFSLLGGLQSPSHTALALVIEEFRTVLAPP